MRRRLLSMCVGVGGLLLALALATSGLAFAADSPGTLKRLADGVYLFIYGGHRSLFVSTTEGVVATDPQSPPAARHYLRLIRQVTQTPVRYVIYSHRHADHIAGGAIFAQAIFISHQNAQRRIISEMKADVIVPQIGFKDRLTIRLGGRTIEVHFLGKSETDDNVFVFLPKEKILFAVDSVGNRSVPWGYMDDAHPLEWIETLKRVKELNFEMLALGHGEPGTKQTVRERRQYLTDLVRGVGKLMNQGLDADQIRQQFRLPKYQHWNMYEHHFPLNVERIYEVLEEAREKRNP